MKVYHVNKENMCLRKDRAPYQEKLTYVGAKKYWGSIIIFEEEERSDYCFAILISPDGTKLNNLTRATFKMLTKHLRKESHIYERGLNSAERACIRKLIKKMSETDKYVFLDFLDIPKPVYEINCPILNDFK